MKNIEREATSGGDELGNLPGLIDYEYVDGDDDPGLHRRVTLDADQNGNLRRPPRRPTRSDVPVGIAKADLVYDLEWQQSGEKFDSTTSFPRPSKSNFGYIQTSLTSNRNDAFGDLDFRTSRNRTCTNLSNSHLVTSGYCNGAPS